MLKVLAIGLLFLANSAMAADWSGSWSGTVTVNENGQERMIQANVSLARRTNKFVLSESVFECVTEYTIQGQDLYVEDSYKVGSYSDTTFSVDFDVYELDSNRICKRIYTLTKDGTNVKFSDKYTCEDGYYTKTEGTLAPARAQAIVKSNSPKL